MMLDLDCLEVLAMKATPGPWLAQYEAADEQFCVTGAGHFDGGRWMVCPEVATLERGGEDDAAFIEAARTAVPELIARVRELEHRLAIKEGADAPLTALPALAGVTDEMVEAGALALVRHVEGGRPARPVSAHARELARVVLEAVIGKEQADERG